ncbi:MAG: hypothetical protein ACPKQO_00480 [Nitrososphaeraceae archaeon]
MAIIKFIELEKLLLNSSNSRIPRNLIGSNEKEIINHYLLADSTLELMLSIGENGFFEGEQLYVIPFNDNYFKVIDGNKRLASVLLLNNPDLAQVKKSGVNQVYNEAKNKSFNKLPCLVFENENDIIKYLGYKHITGISSWKLLEKARYMTRLYNDCFSKKSLKDASREIAKMVGSRKNYILRILSGYKLYEVIEKNNFYGIKTIDDSNFLFNYISESLNREGIQKFLGVDLDKNDPTENINHSALKEWTNWLFNKNLPNKITRDNESLDSLNKIVVNKKALEAFRSGIKLQYALEYTNEINNQFKYLIKKALGKIQEADSLMHKKDIFYEDLEEDLLSINKIIRKIKNNNTSNEFEL